MKKRNLKSLKLNKKSISSFAQNRLAGGSRTSNICSVGCSLAGGCGTGDPVPSGKPACNDE